MEIHVGDVRFSCAHFIEIGGAFERLHGHNMTISADVGSVKQEDMVMDFRRVEAILEDVASSLDHRLLLPRMNPSLSLSRSGAYWEIVAGKKRYRIPQTDVVILPISNSTAEEIGRHIYCAVAGMLPADVRLTRLTLEEAEGKQAIIDSG